MTKQIIQLTVGDMSCMHCQNAVRKALCCLGGVSGVTIDMESKQVQVEYDVEQLQREDLIAAIQDQGYKVN